ncbi:MAG: FG-GAP repeat protein [Planctomycetota bacterium]
MRWTKAVVASALAALVPGTAPVHAQWRFTEIQQLVAPDAASEMRFGSAVGLDGDVAVLGAWGDDERGSDAGSAYVYRWHGPSLKWVFEQELWPSDGNPWDYFGSAVAVSGAAILVGAPRHDGATGEDSGAAYLFRYDPVAQVWVEAQELTASDGQPGDRFGEAIAFNGDVAVISATGHDAAGSWSGAAYVFRKAGVALVQEQKLVASDGRSGDSFGSSVSRFGNVILVGAPHSGDPYPYCGAAYVFRFDGTRWVEEQKLRPSKSRTDAYFGSSVVVSGDVALVGARRDDVQGD